MSIRLTPHQPTRWLDLVGGVSVEVRPAVSAILQSGVYALRAGADPGDQDDALVKAIARRAIVGWTGVLDDNGQPAAVAPALIEALMDLYPLARAFDARYIAPAFAAAREMTAEGEGSAAAPTGTGAAAPATAESAGTSGATAPDGALTKRRPPKP